MTGTALALLVSFTMQFTYFEKPPLAYQTAPHGYVREKIVPQSQLWRYCGTLPDREILGCTRGRTKYMPNPCDYPVQGPYAELDCHENGHVNGWRHELDPRDAPAYIAPAAPASP